MALPKLAERTELYCSSLRGFYTRRLVAGGFYRLMVLVEKSS